MLKDARTKTDIVNSDGPKYFKFKHESNKNKTDKMRTELKPLLR